MTLAALYRERSSWLHAVPAAVKLVLLAAAGTALFMTQDLRVLAPAAACAAALLLPLRPLGAGPRALLRAVAIGALLVAAFHAVTGRPGPGLANAARLVAMGALGIALTLSTRHSELIDVFERLLAPLARFGLRPDRLGLQVGLMLRFTEHFFVQWRRLDDAHRARTGAPGRLRLLAPLTIQLLLGARRVGDALQLRLADPPPDSQRP